MLLAAGLGLRMRPLTQDRPKPALSVLGRPMIVQNLLRMAEASVASVVVNLHYRPDMLRDMLSSGSEDGLPDVRFTFEDPILGTGGGLQKAAELLRGRGTFLVHNSDFLSDIDFDAARETHERGEFLATLVLIPHRDGYSVVEMDDRGCVISLAGVPSVEPGRSVGSFLFTGCHVLEDSLLDRLPPDGPSNIIDLYRELAAEGRLGAHLHDGFWWEFGSPRRFLDGQLELLGLDEDELVRVCNHDPVRELAGCVRVAVGAGADLDAGVELRGRCALGLAVRVGSKSHLTNTVVLEESWSGPECRLDRVIVGPHTELPAGFEAENAVVCPDLTRGREPDPGVERWNGLLIRPFGE